MVHLLSTQGGGGVKIGQNLVHVFVECPLSKHQIVGEILFGGICKKKDLKRAEIYSLCASERLLIPSVPEKLSLEAGHFFVDRVVYRKI